MAFCLVGGVQLSYSLPCQAVCFSRNCVHYIWGAHAYTNVAYDLPQWTVLTSWIFIFMQAVFVMWENSHWNVQVYFFPGFPETLVTAPELILHIVLVHISYSLHLNTPCYSLYIYCFTLQNGTTVFSSHNYVGCYNRGPVVNISHWHMQCCRSVEFTLKLCLN